MFKEIEIKHADWNGGCPGCGNKNLKSIGIVYYELVPDGAVIEQFECTACDFGCVCVEFSVEPTLVNWIVPED